MSQMSPTLKKRKWNVTPPNPLEMLNCVEFEPKWVHFGKEMERIAVGC